MMFGETGSANSPTLVTAFSASKELGSLPVISGIGHRAKVKLIEVM